MKLFICLFYFSLSILNVVAQSISNETLKLLYFDEEFEQAAVLGEKLVSSNKTANSESYFYLGLSYQAVENHAKAIVNFEKARNETNRAKIDYAIAKSYSELGMYNNAISILENSKQNSKTLKLLSILYINVQQYEKALNIMLKLQEKDSTNILYNKQIAYCYDKLDSVELSIKYYNLVVEQVPNDINSILQIANLYVSMQKHNKANEYLEKGLEIDSLNLKFLKKKAFTHLAMSQYVPTITYFQKYIALNKSSLKVNKYIGFCLYQEKKYEAATYYLSQALEEAPDDALSAYYLGITERKLGNYNLSERHLSLALKLALPSNISDFYNQLAQAYKLNLKFEASLETYSISKIYSPDDSEILMQIGILYDKHLSKSTQALAFYQEALKTSKDDDKTLFLMERIERLKEELFFEEKKKK